MKPLPLHRCLPKLVGLFAATVALGLMCLSTDANATCSDIRIKRLSGQGKTLAAIARACQIDIDEVRDVLDAETDEDEQTSGGQTGATERPRAGRSTEGLAPGAPLASCGCWGAVSPNYRESNQVCRSGYAVPRICRQMCPYGGYAWQGVCG